MSRNRIKEGLNQRLESSVKSDNLYEVIRERICLLEYPPGMALREEALAGEFDVSRTPVRRVLQQLEHEGLVTHSQGMGVIVTTIDLKQLKDVYALRMKIAEFMGEMMVIHTSDALIVRLEAILSACHKLEKHYDVTALGRLYNQFHTAMLETISNRPLQKISDQLFHQTARVWLDILPDLGWKEEVEIMCEEVSDVIACLKADDMRGAAEVRRDHMSRLLLRINRYLGSADQSRADTTRAD